MALHEAPVPPVIITAQSYVYIEDFIHVEKATDY